MANANRRRSPRLEWAAALFLANGAALLVYILAGVSLRRTVVALGVVEIAGMTVKPFEAWRLSASL